MADKLYKDALNAALKEHAALQKQERDILVRKARLQETINALSPLVYPNTFDANSLSLPDAMRLVIRSAGRGLSAVDFRTKLQDIGFDISKFENPLANISTTMNRMVESEELHWVEKTDGKKEAIPGPELKDVPQQISLADLEKALEKTDSDAEEKE